MHLFLWLILLKAGTRAPGQCAEFWERLWGSSRVSCIIIISASLQGETGRGLSMLYTGHSTLTYNHFLHNKGTDSVNTQMICMHFQAHILMPGITEQKKGEVTLRARERRVLRGSERKNIGGTLPWGMSSICSRGALSRLANPTHSAPISTWYWGKTWAGRPRTHSLGVWRSTTYFAPSFLNV